MNSHCLYCGKRLSFFHDKKKPYCSDVHEDRYRERESQTGLSRLQEDYLAPARQEVQPVPGLPPPKVPEVFSYEAVDPAILEDVVLADEEIAGHGGPPAAAYLMADPNVVHATPPALSLRDPGDAAFPEEEWGGAAALDISSELLSLGGAQIGLRPVTFPRAERVVVEAVIAPTLVAQKLITERAETQPEPPAQVTSLAHIETQPVPIWEALPEGIFCEPLWSNAWAEASAIALPGIAQRARHSTLAPVAPQTLEELAQNEYDALCAEPGALDSLGVPEPLRFRTVLDLHNQIFQTTRRRIAPASPVPLEWNALRPETNLWTSQPVRRQAPPLIPGLSGNSGGLSNKRQRKNG